VKHFLFLVWLRGQSRPNNFTVAGDNIAHAMLVLFATCGIRSDEVEKVEVYP
jgi:hypothetical protein